MKGIIYKIHCKVSGLCYIGSTINNIPLRLALHKYHYKLYKDNKFKYITVFDIFEKGNYEIEIIEELNDLENKKDLLQRERFYILNTNSVNIKLPLNSKKDYYEQNKEILKTKARNYYYDNLQRYKDQYQLKKDELKIKAKEYYRKNRDTILQKKKEKKIENNN